MIVIERTFTDNNHYSDRWAYLDELVSSLDCLYDDSSSESLIYSLPYYDLLMYDFMSCVDYFICAAISKQPKINIKDYISMFCTGTGNSEIFTESMKHDYYEKDGRHFLKCIKFNYALIEAIVWTAYIYCFLNSKLFKGDRWAKGTKILYESLYGISGYESEEAFLASNWLMRNKQETIKKFAESVQETMNFQKDINNANVSTKDKEQKQDDIEDEQIDITHPEQVQLRVRIEFVLGLLNIKDPNVVPNKSALARLLAEILNEKANTIYTTLYRRYADKTYSLNKKTHGEDVNTFNKLLDECGIDNLKKLHIII